MVMRENPKKPARPRILYIVPADYEALKTKGVDRMIFERDEGGYFERVVTVHPTATQTRVIPFNQVFVLHEVGMEMLGKPIRNRLLLFLFTPFHLLRVVWVIFKLIRKEQIGLIRANDPYWVGLAGFLAAKASGLPLCVSIHADYDKRLELTGGGLTFTYFGLHWPARLVARLVLSSADRVLPIRESLGDWAVAHGAPRAKVRVIPHGIDIQDLETGTNIPVRERLGLPSNRKIVSFVGRLTPENYLPDLLEAARRLVARRHDFCVVLAGGGELEGWIRQTLQTEPRLASVIRLVGFQPRSLCFALRQQSAVSLCLMGGFSLIEACLAGRPVIAYDVEWHRELVKDRQTGFLVKEHDVEGIVFALNHLLDHEEEARAMGKLARSLAFERHDRRNTSAIKREIFSQILARPEDKAPKQDAPLAQIAAGNSWYTSSQFKDQLGSPGKRRIIENRWNIFQVMIQQWARQQNRNLSEERLRLLDAGCGDGINMAGLAERAKTAAWNFAITGVDYNPLRVRRAIRLDIGLPAAQSTLYTLPFRDGTFDVILCNHVLEHVPEPEKALRELRRVLRQEGLLIVGVPNEGCFLAKMRNRVFQRSILRHTDHLHFFTRESCSQLLQGTGFHIQRVEGETFFFPLSYLNMLATEFSTGHLLMSTLRRLFPSQAGGIILSAQRTD